MLQRPDSRRLIEVTLVRALIRVPKASPRIVEVLSHIPIDPEAWTDPEREASLRGHLKAEGPRKGAHNPTFRPTRRTTGVPSRGRSICLRGVTNDAASRSLK
jgi:hypothetical protein